MNGSILSLVRMWTRDGVMGDMMLAGPMHAAASAHLLGEDLNRSEVIDPGAVTDMKDDAHRDG